MKLFLLIIIMISNEIVYHNNGYMYSITIGIAKLNAFSCAKNENYTRTISCCLWFKSVPQDNLFLENRSLS